jgi:hypothetical protein
MDIDKEIAEYRNKIFNTMIEGCQMAERGLNPNYFGLKLSIPKNVSIVAVPQYKFLLYVRDFDLSNKLEIPSLGKGFSIEETVGNLVWFFECPRSLITKDGRIYIREDAFTNSRKDYLEGLVPKILKDCKKIFEKGLTPEEVESYR